MSKTINDSRENCPGCNAQLQGNMIPEDQWDSFGATHFSRKIGIYDRGKDRTVEWMCPDRRHTWDRK